MSAGGADVGGQTVGVADVERQVPLLLDQGESSGRGEQGEQLHELGVQRWGRGLNAGALRVSEVLGDGWNTITGRLARTGRLKPPPRLQTLLVDLWARLPASEHTYRDQWAYVFQWHLWGAEALDVFFLDRLELVRRGQPWPWWLKYNPPWLVAYSLLVACFAAGCALHCLVYQGYPVPDECPEERRFRIHFVYGFDAYLGFMVFVSICCLFTFPDDARVLAVEGIVLTVLWITGNSLGLMAMYGQSNTGIRCFVAGQVAWTTILTVMVLFDLIFSFSAVALYHLVAVVFFWIAVLAYMIPYGSSPGLWGLYIENRRASIGWHRAAITLTVFVVIVCSLLVLYAAGDVLWVIISGSIVHRDHPLPSLPPPPVPWTLRHQ